MKKEYTKKEIVIVIIISIFNNSSFDFFNLLLPLLFDMKLKTLLININILNRIPIVF